jgi:hypothetical protein
MRQLDEKDIKAVCQSADYGNGEDYFRKGKVTDTWQTENSIHASVAGSGKRPYQVSITDQDRKLTPKCTCPAHRRRPFCKHVSAVLIAWARTPERFVVGQAIAPPKPQSQVKRARQAKVGRRKVQMEGLDKVEELLVELTSYGLLSLTEAQIARVGDLAHTTESHKLRRLARRVTLLGKMLETARTDPESFEETTYAELLSDTWLTVQATRRALEDPKAEPTLLDELIGKTWREKDLERRENARLVELAYETVTLDTGFIIDTSYLFSLDDGVLYTEKQIVPAKFKKQARKPSYNSLLVGTIGLYPGPEPRRARLIETNQSPITESDWQQALVHAERSVPALFQCFQAATSNPLAPPEAYALFAPAQIFVDDTVIYLLDEGEQAIPVNEGGQVLSHLMRYSVSALFGRVKLTKEDLAFTPLGLITASPETTLIRIRY